MKIVNLTPHLIHETTSDRVFPSDGIARAEVKTERIGDIGGIPLSSAAFGAPEGLPDPEPGTIYIVSLITYEAAGRRPDLVYPGELIRDEEGKPIGCVGFRR